MMKNLAKNGNQAKVVGLGGEIGISSSFTLMTFFPGHPTDPRAHEANTKRLKSNKLTKSRYK
jgi:hypothetical protein